LKTLIDALPASPPPTLKSGDGFLDGSGVLDISGATSAPFAIGSWYNSPGTGRIYTLGAPLRIARSASARTSATPAPEVDGVRANDLKKARYSAFHPRAKRTVPPAA